MFSLFQCFSNIAYAIPLHLFKYGIPNWNSSHCSSISSFPRRSTSKLCSLKCKAGNLIRTNEWKVSNSNQVLSIDMNQTENFVHRKARQDTTVQLRADAMTHLKY